MISEEMIFFWCFINIRYLSLDLATQFVISQFFDKFTTNNVTSIWMFVIVIKKMKLFSTETETERLPWGTLMRIPIDSFRETL